jgi:hypothetical protein
VDSPADAPFRREHATARGSVRIDRIDERLVHMIMRGMLVEQDGVLVARWLDECLPAARAATLFFDLDELDSYESPVRKLAQRVLKRHEDRWTSIHALVRSRIVAMGVSVANTLLGGRIEIHRDRAAFDRALAHTRARM